MTADDLPPEIQAGIEEARRHPERRVPYRRSADQWADLIQACNQADTPAQQAGRRAVLASADEYWRARSKLMRQYAPSQVATCPDCCGDLTHEGADQYWCGACRESHPFTQVELQDETDYDRD